MHQKYRWSKVYESSEEELVALLVGLNRSAQRITSEESNKTTRHAVKLPCTIWCAEGSLTVSQAARDDISLQPGDALQVGPDTTYTLAPGISGYVCYLTD